MNKKFIKIFLAASFISIVILANYGSARARSLVCQKYDHHRTAYKNLENKIWYLKTRWLKNHNKAVYDYYKSIYDTYNTLSIGEIYKLNIKKQEIFFQFRGYERYNKYLSSKSDCQGHKDSRKSSSAKLSSEKQILSFSVSDPDNIDSISGVINENDHTIIFDAIGFGHNPICNNMWRLLTNIAISPNAEISPSSGIETSFDHPVIYTVMAEDGTEQQYTAAVENCPA
jgi:hypothetical protein